MAVGVALLAVLFTCTPIGRPQVSYVSGSCTRAAFCRGRQCPQVELRQTREQRGEKKRGEKRWVPAPPRLLPAAQTAQGCWFEVGVGGQHATCRPGEGQAFGPSPPWKTSCPVTHSRRNIIPGIDGPDYLTIK